MKIIHSNLWDSDADVFAVTTCSVLSAGRLVMGAGAARQMRDRYPQVNRFFGARITQVRDGNGDYGWITTHPETAAAFRSAYQDERRDFHRYLAVFQSKRHWRENASLEVIALSAQKLKAWCDEHPSLTVACNFPGIGFGGLDKRDVMEVLEQANLPDTVTFHMK